MRQGGNARMRRRCLATGLVLLLAGQAAAQGDTAPTDRLRQAARADYVLQCAGCHRGDGRGSNPHGIPDFRQSAQLPADFVPYDEAEVAAARPRRYDDVVPVRHELAKALAAMGFTLSDYSYGNDRKP